MSGHEFGLPEIFEHEAQGYLATVYQDIQHVLKVPVVNFIFRTLAFYEDFLGIAWQQVRPNMLTVEMEEAAHEIRYPDVSLKLPSVDWRKIYDDETIQKIRKIIFTFNYVNPKLLLIASAWSESLGSRPIEGVGMSSGFIQPGIIPGLPKIRMVKIEKAAPQVQSLLLDIIKQHHAYDAASDYRALANYPQFLSIGWNALKPYIGSKEYTLLKERIKTKSIESVHNSMRFPISFSTNDLAQYYYPRDIAGILGIVSMFQDLLPGLIIEMEVFRQMIR
ncbi:MULTISPECIES: halocarboxylic acid dehydrogenase DehI family protein [unclassified Bacillus (in: firmicutes)]|uniref:halocarboxylic acid dehydrogenase DehI family protein n=1 Tax=unclassified Bacillus (in: firmicutes) TaxID=185979 RepID=UPI001BE708ED|nr:MULTISPECIES: halocarboxylic acid dehydrogenase DehI family protein [unclassified Bacillus (in: firmicutes)]MBT2639277.1 hypothetical protein [Bacillus sp. ISL-39]MBT2659792.1 hypothetical protein [Bacillus sp. ISL-45]